LVVFAHGGGSSRHNPRSQQVAETIRRAGFGTLLVDLLTPQESYVDEAPGPVRLRRDIDLLATRLVDVVDRIADREEARSLPVGLFGVNAGGGAALIAAALRPQLVAAVVSHGGQSDLAEGALAHVHSPVLLIVGGDDAAGLASSRAALLQLQCPRALEVIAGATSAFEEPGVLDEMAVLARDWFKRYCSGARQAAA
jgi:dienelactone hydrolase